MTQTAIPALFTYKRVWLFLLTGALAVVLGFFAFGAIHYLLWGWWLRPVPIKDDPDADGPPSRRD